MGGMDRTWRFSVQAHLISRGRGRGVSFGKGLLPGEQTCQREGLDLVGFLGLELEGAAGVKCLQVDGVRSSSTVSILHVNHSVFCIPQ